MRNRLVGSILAVVAVLAFSPVMLAQQPGAADAKPAPRKPDGKPDLSGVWERPGTATRFPGGLPGDNSDIRGSRRAIVEWEAPELQPWAMEIYNVHRRGVKKPTSDGREELDPQFNCFPPGPTRLLTSRPFEFIQLPGRVLIFSENDHWVRQIYMDGRGHPDGYPITWMGHSIGTWDGDTLVIDTVGINDKTWIDSLGHPHSDALHIVERVRRINHVTLQIEITYDDPKAYTKPGREKKVFQLMPPGFEIMEHVKCEEHLEIGKRVGQMEEWMLEIEKSTGLEVSPPD